MPYNIPPIVVRSYDARTEKSSPRSGKDVSETRQYFAFIRTLLFFAVLVVTVLTFYFWIPRMTS